MKTFYGTIMSSVFILWTAEERKILLSKQNILAIEASVFNGPFAVYKDFIPSVNQYGEPRSYHPTGFPASTSTVTLLSNFLQEVRNGSSWHLQSPTVMCGSFIIEVERIFVLMV
jgi:hypothetical protein